MPGGSLALVVELHHPMPGPNSGDGLPPDWHVSALRLYWPLARAAVAAADAGLADVLTIAVSPAWSALAADPLARRSCTQALDELADHPQVPEAPRWHELRQWIVDRWDGDLLAALRRAAESGAIELIPTAASHAWLPGVVDSELMARAQVAPAVADFTSRFGAAPSGLWLPHLAYRPGFERALGEAGVRYFGVDAHAFRRGTVRPPLDLQGPLVTAPGVAAFGVDPAPTEPITDPARRYARDADYADPRHTADAARRHAEHFVSSWRGHAHSTASGNGPRLSVAAISVHDLGRDWPGAFDWLEQVLPRLAEGSPWAATTPGRFLDRSPEGPLGRPGPSTGGELAARPGGSDLLDRLLAAGEALAEIVERSRDLDGPPLRAAAQAVRSLLLAQALDWSIPDGQLGPRAGLDRAEARLAQLAELAPAVLSGRVDAARLATLEAGPPYLPALDVRSLAV